MRLYFLILIELSLHKLNSNGQIFLIDHIRYRIDHMHNENIVITELKNKQKDLYIIEAAGVQNIE